jgi:hypothetical protein
MKDSEVTRAAWIMGCNSILKGLPALAHVILFFTAQQERET